jgi:hypothetical protein
MSVNSAAIPSTTVELNPSYRLPTLIAIAALPLLWLQIWVGTGVLLFAIFLAIQAATLRLQFTETALDIYRGKTLIRHFPYEDWRNWQIFWGSIPILFYFKEVKSIHFLPILFDPTTLQACLEERCPRATLVR